MVFGLLGTLRELWVWGRAFKLQNWPFGWEVLARLLTANFEIGTPDPLPIPLDWLDQARGVGKYKREGSKESNGGKGSTADRADGA